MKKQNDYPEIVTKIHKEFNEASDVILKEAEEYLNGHANLNEEKIKRLEKIGFGSVKEVKDSEEIRQRKGKLQEASERIQAYAQKYPLYKFIDEEKRMRLCRKYGLYCADIAHFKGFVPEKNLDEIEGFLSVIKKDDIDIDRGIFISNFMASPFSPAPTKEEQQKRDKAYEDSLKKPLQICAPLKDFDTTDLRVNEDDKTLQVYNPDPVVLQPVKGGYLIVSAWGDEASDPIVVNEKNN